jgi:hypothetical protein
MTHDQTPAAPSAAPPRTTVDDARQRTFLDALWRTRCIRDAAREAGVGKVTAYRWRRRDPGFAREWALLLALPLPHRAARRPTSRNRLVTEALSLIHRDGGGTKCPGVRDMPSPTSLPLLRFSSMG